MYVNKKKMHVYKKKKIKNDPIIYLIYELNFI